MHRASPPILILAGILALTAFARADVGPSPDAGTETRPLIGGREREPIAQREGKERGSSTIPAMLAVLALIVGLGVVWRQVAKRGGVLGAIGAGGRAPAGVVEVLARYPVGRGQTLVLIKIDRRVLVTSHSGSGMRTLCDITEPDEVASLLVKTQDEAQSSLDARFRGLLERFSGAHEDHVAASSGGEPIPIVDLTRGPTKVKASRGRVA